MIQLISKTLKGTTIQLLAIKQSRINALPTFIKQTKKAKTLWNGKKGSNASQTAFTEIKDKLIKMSVGVEICNYCKNNEATDIEHIFPKSWFPNKTFIWENYLLACRTCNTDYKSNRFAIFVPKHSSNILDIIAQPPNDDSAFINLQTENPLDFFFLNLRRGIFTIHPNLINNTQSIAYIKADYTLEMLALNTRDALVNARKSAVKYYLDRLERYTKIKATTTAETLEIAIDPIEEIIDNVSFNTEKTRFLEAVKQEIKNYAHPTVWEELKRQKENFPGTNHLFQQAPEASDW
ncbi:MAG: HNH endonuclease [Saprospiraceae bacterium]